MAMAGCFLFLCRATTGMGNLVNSGGRWFFFLAETQNTQAKPQNADKTTAAFLALSPVFRSNAAEQNRQQPVRCGA